MSHLRLLKRNRAQLRTPANSNSNPNPISGASDAIRHRA